MRNLLENLLASKGSRAIAHPTRPYASTGVHVDVILGGGLVGVWSGCGYGIYFFHALNFQNFGACNLEAQTPTPPPPKENRQTSCSRELFRKIRVNFWLLPCDTKQRPSRNVQKKTCSDELFFLGWIILGGFSCSDNLGTNHSFGFVGVFLNITDSEKYSPASLENWQTVHTPLRASRRSVPFHIIQAKT